jgi:hypothetical protein
MKTCLLASAWVLAWLALQPQAAAAANTPQVGAAPSWVRAAPAIPPEKSDIQGLPVVMRLDDIQLSLDADSWTEFHEIQAKVQSPTGLQALGAIPFQWSPWSDTLTFHHARIVRDGQTIDILPKDGAFTVLRRETGLEQAMLTGVLTAVLQPEGLQGGRRDRHRRLDPPRRPSAEGADRSADRRVGLDAGEPFPAGGALALLAPGSLA